MSIQARTVLTSAANSYETGRETGLDLRSGGQPPSALLAYLTVNHDQAAFLAGLQEGLGELIPVVGCSVQGIIGPQCVREDGYAAGVMALGGDGLSLTSAEEEDISVEPLAKGKTLGRRLLGGLKGPARFAVLHWDPLCGVDIEVLLQGMHQELGCPILGGSASHAFSYQKLGRTYQYSGRRVLKGAAAALAVAGDFGMELDICHGCSPVGVAMTVTRAEGTMLLELDGRPAFQVLSELCGASEPETPLLTALALGLPGDPSSAQSDYAVRGVYTADAVNGGVTLATQIAAGTQVMLHHRTVQDVMQGAERMAKGLRARLAERKVRAVLGFECGARTGPFLGQAATLEENLLLQRTIGSDAAWMAPMVWGEAYPVSGKPRFHNYSYPVLAMTD